MRDTLIILLAAAAGGYVSQGLYIAVMYDDPLGWLSVAAGVVFTASLAAFLVMEGRAQ